MAVKEENSRSDLEHAVSGISLEQYLNKTASCPNPEWVFEKAKRRTNLWRECNAENRSISVVQHTS